MTRSRRPLMPAWLVPIAILLVLGTIWGSITNIARFVGRQAAVAPVEYAIATLLIAGLFLLVVNLLRPRVPQPTRQRTALLSRRHLMFYLASGALGSAIPTVNMFFVLQHLSAGRMSIVLATVPLFTYALALLIRSEEPRPLRMLGVGLGFLGSVIVIASNEGEYAVANDSNRFWFLVAFLTPLFYAIGNHVTARFRPRVGDSLSMANGMVLGAAFILIAVAMVVALFGRDVEPLWFADPFILLLIAVHGILSGIAFTLFFVLIKIAGPVYFSQVAYLVTVFGIGIGMWVFNERHPPLLWVAVVVIFLGLLLVNLSQPDASRTESS